LSLARLFVVPVRPFFYFFPLKAVTPLPKAGQQDRYITTMSSVFRRTLKPGNFDADFVSFFWHTAKKSPRSHGIHDLRGS